MNEYNKAKLNDAKLELLDIYGYNEGDVLDVTEDLRNAIFIAVQLIDKELSRKGGKTGIQDVDSC